MPDPEERYAVVNGLKIEVVQTPRAPRKKKNKGTKSADVTCASEQILSATPDDDGDIDQQQPITKVERQFIRFADKSAGGKPLPTFVNAMQCIIALGLECKHDIFRDRYTINGSSLQRFEGDLSDAVTRKIREMSRARFGLDPGKDNTAEAVLRICEENKFHPLQDYMTALRWDGMPRIETWLPKYLGVEDTELTRAQGAIVISALIKRTFEPGCKFDHILVLEGPEGGYKSSVVRVLANGTRDGSDYFSDSPILHVDERKQMELTVGILGYELAELAGMREGRSVCHQEFRHQAGRASAARLCSFPSGQPSLVHLHRHVQHYARRRAYRVPQRRRSTAMVAGACRHYRHQRADP